MTHTLCILKNCWKWTLFIQQHTVLTRSNSLPTFTYSTTEELYHHLALHIIGCNTLPLCNWACYFHVLWSYISEVHCIMQIFFLTYCWVTEHSFLWRPGLPVLKVRSSSPSPVINSGQTYGIENKNACRVTYILYVCTLATNSKTLMLKLSVLFRYYKTTLYMYMLYMSFWHIFWCSQAVIIVSVIKVMHFSIWNFIVFVYCDVLKIL
jgi:hypothetical protein